MLEKYKEEAARAAQELLKAAKLNPGEILVAGCSSSEIAAHKIGSYSSAEIGKAVFEGIYEITKKQGVYLAAQCSDCLLNTSHASDEL